MAKTRVPLCPVPSIEEVAIAITIPVEEWPGNCHAIAVAAQQAGLFPGVKSRYGHYSGPVAEGSMFHKHKYPRHGWLVRGDGVIIDPTRWVFEDVEPYIAVIPPFDAEKQAQYDVGGARLERALFGDRPPPGPTEGFGARKKPEKCPLWIKSWQHGAANYIWNIFQCAPQALTLAQVYWLAHRLPEEFGGRATARAIFEAIALAGRKVFIPIDYWHAVVEEPL